MSVWIILLGILMAFVIRRFYKSKQYARKLNALWLLSTAIKYQLPLPELLESQAAEHWGRFRYRLLDFADMLKQGIPLPVAIDSYHQLFPPSGRTAIRVGGETDTLQESLESTALYIERVKSNSHLDISFRYFVLALIFSTVTAISLFLLYTILPKYEIVYQGFTGSLPGTFSFLLKYVDFIISIFSFFGFCILIWALLRPLKKIQFFRTFVYTFFDFIPILSWPLTYMIPRPSTAEMLRYLAVTSQDERPLLPTLFSLSRHIEDSLRRHQLKKISIAVENGEELWGQFSARRIITPHEAALLRTAEASGELTFALQQMSLTYEQRREQWIETRWNIFWAVSLILVTCWIAFFSIAMFLPLVELISDLSLREVKTN